MNENNHDGEKPADKGFHKTFPVCPGCGSSERFYESLLNELKGRGLIDQKVNCFGFQLQEGFPLPQQKINTLPFGSEIPRFTRIVDTCCNCGLEYAIKLEKQVAKKSINLAQQMPPMPLNRAQRRQIERLN